MSKIITSKETSVVALTLCTSWVRPHTSATDSLFSVCKSCPMWPREVDGVTDCLPNCQGQ